MKDAQDMAQFELAQVNIGRLLAPLDSPQTADFVNNLERINALAEASPGFVWRLQTDAGDATALRIFDASTLLNMSVWRDVEALQYYVYRTAHVEFVKRRREWFELMRERYLSLWWVPRGHRPSIEEAEGKLELLRAQGPTAAAFTFNNAFPPPDAREASGDSIDNLLPASAHK